MGNPGARALRRTLVGGAERAVDGSDGALAGVLGPGPDLLARPVGGVAELALALPVVRCAVRRCAEAARRVVAKLGQQPLELTEDVVGLSRPRVSSRLTSSFASPRVMRPRRTASSTTSCSRSRGIVTSPQRLAEGPHALLGRWSPPERLPLPRWALSACGHRAGPV